VSERVGAVVCSWLARVLLALESDNIADEDRIAAEACCQSRHSFVLTLVSVGAAVPICHDSVAVQ